MNDKWADPWHSITITDAPEWGDPPEYTLHHPPTCPFEDEADESSSTPRRIYSCGTAEMIDAEGILYVAPDPLVSGTYAVRAWSSTYDGPDGRDWDGGLEWVSVEDMWREAAMREYEAALIEVTTLSAQHALDSDTAHPWDGEHLEEQLALAALRLTDAIDHGPKDIRPVGWRQHLPSLEEVVRRTQQQGKDETA